jgi:hypothetical protein
MPGFIELLPTSTPHRRWFQSMRSFANLYITSVYRVTLNRRNFVKELDLEYTNWKFCQAFWGSKGILVLTAMILAFVKS